MRILIKKKNNPLPLILSDVYMISEYYTPERDEVIGIDFFCNDKNTGIKTAICVFLSDLEYFRKVGN